jgi:uncharacterized delta-60 repeat protein
MKTSLPFLSPGACIPGFRLSLFLIAFATVFGSVAEAQTVAVDSTFGVNGYVPYGLTGNDMQNKGTGNRSAIQPDGKILVAMDQRNPNQADLLFYTYRYNPDGTPDVTFGTNGVSGVFTGDQSKNKDVRVQADGKILVTGESEYCVNGICGAAQLVVMRLLPNGDKDSTFGTDGIILTSDLFGSTGTYAKPERIIVLPDGKYLLAGKGVAADPFVARLNNDGSKDLSFATQGVYSDVDGMSTLIDLITDDSGNIYALLQMYYANFPVNENDTYVWKLTPNGVPDNTFGTAGKRIIDVSTQEFPTSFALRSDNKLVIAGYVQPELIDESSGYGITNEGYILLLDPDGNNSSVLPQGLRMFEIPGDSSTFFHTVKVTAGDQLLIGGRTIEKINGNYHEKAFVSYFDAAGNLDTDFNGTGFMLFDYGLHSNIGSLACFRDLDVLTDGSILATGYRNPIMQNTKTGLFLLKIKGFEPGTSGIAEMDNQVESLLFPNPWKDEATLDFKLETSAAVSIRLLDLAGRTLHTFTENELRPAGNYSEKLLRPAGTGSGAYLLVLTTSTGNAASVKVVFE